LPFAGSDEELLEGLRARQPMATAALCDRYSRWVLRLLGRVLGSDPDLGDLHHEVFAKAIRAAHTIREASAIQGWVGAIAVNVARARLKERARGSWLVLGAEAELARAAAPPVDDELQQALRRCYALLERLSREERIAFTLRFIEGMKLTELADATGVSLATAKRRLGRGEQRFRALAASDPVLRPWLEGGEP
jgi:RNA polymerase sigma-70 factor (ECF subfamily)